MQVFLVGGSVRDMIFGIEPKDRDYVVIGATPQQMIDLGYSQVGKDFPVFLHPITKDEYALARTERKSGNGYKGFIVTTSPDITLEQDLKRRDLTMNAIAYGEDGKYYDPYGGRKDINSRILRHVDSEAFAEDPLRVLRLARFCAKFPDFSVDPDTQKMCEDLVASGELNHLTVERVRDEMYKALAEKQPSRFFIFLAMIGALEVVFPEIHALIGKTQPFKYHPEGDAFTHTMLVLDQMTESMNRSKDLKILYRFCALTHDLGKGTSPIETLPHHKGHEMRGYDIVGNMCQRLHISNTIRHHAQLVARYHHHIHGFMGLRVGTVVSMFDDLATNRNEHIIDVLTLTSKCDARGRGSFFADTAYPQAAKAVDVLRRMTTVRASSICENIEEMSVPQIKAAVFEAKADIVRKYRGQ